MIFFLFLFNPNKKIPKLLVQLFLDAAPGNAS